VVTGADEKNHKRCAILFAIAMNLISTSLG